jgi:hypothetical protein
MIRAKKRSGEILSELRERGFAGRHYVETWRGPDAETWVSEYWSDDEAFLRQRLCDDMRLRLCTYALLWQFVQKTKKRGEWVVLEELADPNQRPS